MIGLDEGDLAGVDLDASLRDQVALFIVEQPLTEDALTLGVDAPILEHRNVAVRGVAFQKRRLGIDFSVALGR